MSKKFSKLGVSEAFQKSLADLAISIPTDIQVKTIPLVLTAKKDIVALAKTGTGKTAAFGLPLLQLIATDSSQIQTVILAPTRELGQQIYANLVSFSKHSPAIKIASICGGTPIKPQIEQLKSTTHVVVATPGRLVDLIQKKAINLKNVAYLVLDEADEMVTALKQDLDPIVAELPESRRTLLFTATMPGAIKQVVQNYLNKNVMHLEADMETIGHQGIDHHYIVVEPIEKLDVLLHFLSSREGEQGIIFCKTKAAVNKLAKNLAINKFSSGALHGSLTQAIRDRVMGQFRDGHLKLLVATDLASRGIDVKNIGFIINYHLPETYDLYVHRSGRTARAGANGLSLTIIQKEEEADIPVFEKELGINFHKIKKASAASIEETNTLLWATRIFKTKPNREVSDDFKNKIKTIFHHLTKEELIEKVLANHLEQHSSVLPKEASLAPKKKK
jgi:ATP-dependent RNA helicase DeaD